MGKERHLREDDLQQGIASRERRAVPGPIPASKRLGPLRPGRCRSDVTSTIGTAFSDLSKTLEFPATFLTDPQGGVELEPKLHSRAPTRSPTEWVCLVDD
jgi:hypothetical protein